jgi:alpha-L-rhamnosidase
MYGPIATEWRRDDRTFRLKVTVPANATATVTLPFAGRATEGGAPLEKAPGVKVLEATATGIVVAVESGTYDFSVATP